MIKNLDNLINPMKILVQDINKVRIKDNILKYHVYSIFQNTMYYTRK